MFFGPQPFIQKAARHKQLQVIVGLWETEQRAKHSKISGLAMAALSDFLLVAF